MKKPHISMTKEPWRDAFEEWKKEKKWNINTELAVLGFLTGAGAKLFEKKSNSNMEGTQGVFSRVAKEERLCVCGHRKSLHHPYGDGWCACLVNGLRYCDCQLYRVPKPQGICAEEMEDAWKPVRIQPLDELEAENMFEQRIMHKVNEIINYLNSEE